MIRQPPAEVPKAIAFPESTTPQGATSNWLSCPLAMSPRVIAAIVFWASLPPCEKDTKAAAATWTSRKVRLTGPGRRRWTARTMSVTRIAAITKPRSGEITSEVSCFVNDDQRTAEKLPIEATPAPTRPPIRAWVELLGSPKNQVIRFQAIAPRRAAMMTTIPALKESVLAIVLATLEWNTSTVTRAPRRLKTADRATAWPAVRARVEMEVAIALAVSWKPLVKSKATATTTVAMRRPSSILDRHRLQDVGSMLAGVHRRFEKVVDVLPLDQVGGGVLLGEERGQGFAGQEVGLVLQPVDLDSSWLELAEAVEVLERPGQDVARP